jgi:flagellar biosynthesis chaperone FliJ
VDAVQKDSQPNTQRQLSNLKDEIEQLQQENNKLSENVKKLRKELLENQEYTD